MPGPIHRDKDQLPTTIQGARLAGVNHFYDGRICNHGHQSIRELKQGGGSVCLECKRANANRVTRAAYARDPEAPRAYAKAHQAEKRAARQDWGSKNPERFAQLKASWKVANPAKILAHANARRAAAVNATPKWLTKEHKSQIEAVYKEAIRLTEETGEKHEVDHIVPLQGRSVSGLHVPWNLRVLPAIINNSRPRIWAGMESV